MFVNSIDDSCLNDIRNTRKSTAGDGERGCQQKRARKDVDGGGEGAQEWKGGECRAIRGAGGCGRGPRGWRSGRGGGGEHQRQREGAAAADQALQAMVKRAVSRRGQERMHHPLHRFGWLPLRNLLPNLLVASGASSPSPPAPAPPLRATNPYT